MIVSTSHRVCTIKNIDFTDFFNVFLSGATIVVSSLKVQVQDEIPIYHKMAIEDISLGSPILKYGECIGFAYKDIKQGQHVHTHNLRSKN